MNTLSILFVVAGCGTASEEPKSDEQVALMAPAEPAAEGTPVLNCAAPAKQASAEHKLGTEHYCDLGGEKNGETQVVDDAGNVRLRGKYIFDRPEGPWVWRYANGNKDHAGRYAEGKPIGAWTWWHENGERKEEGDFLTGRREGIWSSWHASGNLASKGMYQNGKKTGDWTLWLDVEDSRVDRLQLFKSGKMVKEEVVTQPDAAGADGQAPGDKPKEPAKK